MKKRIAAAVIAAMMAGTLWGCGTGSGKQEAATQTGQEQAADAQAGQAEADAGEQTGAEADAQAGTDAGEQTGAEADAQAGTNAGEQTGAEADAQAGQAGAQAEQAAAGQAGAQAGQAAAGQAAQESTAADAQAANSALPEVVFEEYNLLETEDDYKVIASGFYNTIKLTQEAAAAYPALNNTVTAQSGEIEKRYDADFEELEEASETFRKQQNMDENDYPTGSLEGRLDVVRCDASVLSLLETTYSFYPGSAHGSTAFRDYNYDTATGEAVKLSDVFADPSALPAVISQNLKIQADGSPYEGTEEELRQYFDGTYEEPAWLIDEQGVTFLFAPAELAPHAAGTLEAKISFTDNASLFTGKYGPAEGAYVRKLATDVPFTADLDGDGVKETLSVNYDYGEGADSYGYEGFKVCVDDSECAVEQYIYSMNAYLIHREDGKNYIYVITQTDNDYEILNVFAISDKKASAAGTLNGTGIGTVYHEVYDEGKYDPEKSYMEIFPLIDPESFALDTRMNLMSTYSAVRSYRVGNDGVPEPLTDYYEIRVERELTSRVPLAAEVVDTTTGEATGEQKEIPAGSKCRLWHTNGVDTVDLMLEDGSAVRVNVVADGWPQTVNGKELEEVFEGTMFAG